MSRSWRNSFARTIREQLPDSWRSKKVAITAATPVGLLARTALYRLKNLDGLRRFLRSSEPCILCRYQTNQSVAEPRYWRRYVTPQHHVATFRFFEQRPKTVSYEQLEITPGTLIPATHKLTLIVPRGTEGDLHSLAAMPWKLFAYDDLANWREITALDSLSTTH